MPPARPDVLVLGSGPAGVLAARACRAAGVDVRLVSRDPDAPWTAHYGLWADELAPGAVAAHRWGTTVVFGHREHPIAMPYALLDNEATRRAWMEGIDVVAATVLGVADGAVRTDRGTLRARVVVDATGPDSTFVERSAPTRFQCGFGIRARVDGHPFGDRMVLMDFRGLTGTFLYAMPLGRDRVFVEETVLVGPGVGEDELERRLYARLERLGVRVLEVEATERCLIPMDAGIPARDRGIVAFGASASMGHLATGYLLPRLTAAAPRLAAAIAADRSPHEAVWTPDDLRRRALQDIAARFIASSRPIDTASFFDAFFDQPPAVFRTFLGPRAASDVRAAMAALFRASDYRTRLRMMRAAGSRLLPQGAA